MAECKYLKEALTLGETLMGCVCLNNLCDPIDLTEWNFSACISSGSLSVGGEITIDEDSGEVCYCFPPKETKCLCPGNAQLFIKAVNKDNPKIVRYVAKGPIIIYRGCC